MKKEDKKQKSDWKRIYNKNELMNQFNTEYDERGREYAVICNHCKHSAYYNTDYGYFVLFNYCPYCGKKMHMKGTK